MQLNKKTNEIVLGRTNLPCNTLSFFQDRRYLFQKTNEQKNGQKLVRTDKTINGWERQHDGINNNT